jgi:hypothetical protein
MSTRAQASTILVKEWKKWFKRSNIHDLGKRWKKRFKSRPPSSRLALLSGTRPRALASGTNVYSIRSARTVFSSLQAHLVNSSSSLP